MAKLFRCVGTHSYYNWPDQVEYESWGKCELSIETMIKLAHLYNLKYSSWYLEYKEE